MSSSNLVRIGYKKETSYGETPAAVHALLVLQDLTFTAVKGGTEGNDISVEYLDTATAGNETVVVTGNAIVIGIESGVSTATQIKTKFDLESDATDLATCTISGTAGDAQTDESTAATASLNLTADITLTSVAEGTARNTNTFTLQVLPADDLPTDEVHVVFTGTAAAIVCTVTPNDGTNNGAVPVDLTTAQLRELITTGAVGGFGGTIVLTDASSRRALQTATGGGATALADGGEGDGVVATFTGGTDDEAMNLATGSGEFKTARFISESYSGSPETTESQQIRTDRQSSGQVVTGLTVGGTHSFELAKEAALEDMMESAMFNTWDTLGAITRTISIDNTAKTITSVTGSWIDDGLEVGDFVKLAGFASAGNNVYVMLTSVGALILGFNGPEGMSTQGAGTGLTRADKLAIGSTKKSLTIEKTFLDLTTKGIIYRGMLAASMELNVEYGSLISGSFGFSGNGYDTADAASEFASYLEYFADPATTDTLNGSVDMPFLSSNVTGSFVAGDLCLQSCNLSLANNLNPQTCIGRTEPENYTPGVAAIEISISSYLKNENWDMLARKLSQASFAIGFMVHKSADGGYGFFMPAIQVSFDDPSSGGANQDISMDMNGVAKVGDNGESALTIYRLVSY